MILYTNRLLYHDVNDVGLINNLKNEHCYLMKGVNCKHYKD